MVDVFDTLQDQFLHTYLFPPSILSLFSWISVGIKLAFSLWELSLFPPVSKWHQPSISDVADWISHPSHSTLWRNTRGIHGVLTEGQEKYCRVSVGQNLGWAEGTVVLSCFQAKYREKSVHLCISVILPVLGGSWLILNKAPALCKHLCATLKYAVMAYLREMVNLRDVWKDQLKVCSALAGGNISFLSKAGSGEEWLK